MKLYRTINSAQSIASFMAGFKKKEMSYEEYNEWSDYLEKSLTTGNVQAKVFYGPNYLQELDREDGGHLFNFGNKSITLAPGKKTSDLDLEVLSYMDVDTLLAIIDAIELYQKESECLGK